MSSEGYLNTNEWEKYKQPLAVPGPVNIGLQQISNDHLVLKHRIDAMKIGLNLFILKQTSVGW